MGGPTKIISGDTITYSYQVSTQVSMRGGWAIKQGKVESVFTWGIQTEGEENAIGEIWKFNVSFDEILTLNGEKYFI